MVFIRKTKLCAPKVHFLVGVNIFPQDANMLYLRAAQQFQMQGHIECHHCIKVFINEEYQYKLEFSI